MIKKIATMIKEKVVQINIVRSQFKRNGKIKSIAKHQIGKNVTIF